MVRFSNLSVGLSRNLFRFNDTNDLLNFFRVQ
jgi:hypothetical protein